MSASARCPVCPHHCMLAQGQVGACRARRLQGETTVCDNYGQLVSATLDPIEKKPLARFMPGTKVLSVGSVGCNMRCPFCQNHEISQVAVSQAQAVHVAPEQLVAKAEQLRGRGNIGIAFTYNEPLVGYEYVRDVSVLARAQDLKTVLVSNGMLCDAPLHEVAPLIDAANIDLKTFQPDVYRSWGGDLAAVRHTIEVLVGAGCHVEATTLLVDGVNDSVEEIGQIASWLASVSPDITYHITRSFPRFHMRLLRVMSAEEVYERAETARRFLPHVFVGNC